MHDYQRAFVDFLLEAEALQVGEFKLKSGRVSPVFFNSGRIDTGGRLRRMGLAYADTILDRVGADGFDVVFGPAYKGIPLAVATVMGLSERGVERAFLADRKEAKTHGAEASGGSLAKQLLGRMPAPDARFVMVDDVLTTGGTKDEAVAFLRQVAPESTFPALLIVLDRQEVTPAGEDAVASFTARTGIGVEPVLKLTDVLDYLADVGRLTPENQARCRRYWGEHGTDAAKDWAAR